MNKISVTLNLSKIDKTRIVDRTYKDKEGNDVTEKNYKVEVIELKQPSFVAEGDTWTMNKTHFVVDAQSKDERAEKKPANYVGEGFQFENKNVEQVNQDLSEIPF